MDEGRSAADPAAHVGPAAADTGLRPVEAALLPQGWGRAATATLVLRSALLEPGVLVEARAGGRIRLQIAVRQRPVESLDHWERLQNYRVHADARGMVGVLECRVLIDPPAELLADLQAGWSPTNGPSTPGLRTQMEQGLVRLGAPLAAAGAAHADAPDGTGSEIAVRIGHARIDLVVDGVIVDSEWPAGRWLPGDDALWVGPAVAQLAAWDRALADGERRWCQEQDRPLAQHWAPHGHNAWAGDTMWCVAGGRLHLYWLLDRRSGTSKWGCSASEFALHATSDLKTWTAHGVAFPITEPHELSLGTGAIILHDGVFHLFSRLCQDRLGPRFEARHPGGMHHATSADGEVFAKLGPCAVTGTGRTRHDLGSEPGMLRDGDGIWHAAAAGTRLTSRDLHHWEVADAGFLPAVGWPCTREVPSNECTCWFRWDGWFYILSGRTGFWMSRDLTGPYWGDSVAAVRPAWDPYDGLMVPQAIVFQGRCLLAGWLAWGERYAAHLVFRELRQRADGNLEMIRLPELEPRCGGARPLSILPSPGVALGDASAVIDARDAPSSAVIPGVGVDVRITVRLAPSGCARYGLRLLAGGPSGTSCELRLEPGRALAQWGTASGGAPAPDSGEMPFWGHDFAILGVEHLDRAIDLDLLVRHDPKSGTVIIDAGIDGRRTLVTRRTETGGALEFWADSGVLAVEGLAIHALERMRP